MSELKFFASEAELANSLLGSFLNKKASIRFAVSRLETQELASFDINKLSFNSLKSCVLKKKEVVLHSSINR